MNSKLLVASTLAALAIAQGTPASQCNTNGLQCCNNVQSSSNPSIAALLKLLGIVVSGVNIPIGVGCTPIDIIGIGSGGSCTAEPVCCTDNVFGPIGVGCTPVNLSL